MFTLRRCALAATILILIGAIRIVSTYTVLSNIVDEPIHLGAGMEWLDHGTITGDASHPPLARGLSALGPWLAGEHWTRTNNTLMDGMAILGKGAHYDRMLSLARLGILTLFLLAGAVVFLWANYAGGPLAGLIATFLFTTIPPVLAHAGLVTTDMAATAFTGAGAYAALLWAERPGPLAHAALRPRHRLRHAGEIFAGGVPARGVGGDVSLQLAGPARDARVRAAALAECPGRGRDCVFRNLGGLPLQLRADGICAPHAACAPLLRWHRHDPAA